MPFNRTPEGFRDQRRFGGTLFKRTAFAGATTGQQLLYALDEQVRRWERRRARSRCTSSGISSARCSTTTASAAARSARTWSRWRSAPFPADAVIVAIGRLRADLRPLDDVDGLHRQRRQPRASGRRQVRQRRVHPGPSHGHSRRRQAAADERIGPRRRGPRLGAAQAARSARPASRFPKPSATTSSKSAIRSTATSCRATSPRARSSTSASNEGLSVEQDRLCVYLDLTHIPRDELDRKLGGILEIYEKFQGVDPRDVPMKIFPAVHYSMGGLWVDYERTADGGLAIGSPRTSRRTSPACTPSASATTSTTAPTAWAPTRCCAASSAA